jgi:DNA-binding CsgD family transcriptional regulator
MPIQSAVLFLVSILASVLLIGFSFALKTRYQARFLDYYFYFIIVVISYGFVNWIGPAFVIYFSEVSSDKSINSIVLFIAIAVPLALVKLYLFILLLLKLLDLTLNKHFSHLFYTISALLIIIAVFVLNRDLGGESLTNSRSFLTLLGVLVLVASFLSIFYFLSRVGTLKNERLERSAQNFGWVYLIAYFVYASPFYLTHFFDLSWYMHVSPYFYYAMHLVPMIFIGQFARLHQLENPFQSTKPFNLDRIVESYDISKRERTILKLVLQGKTNNEIADQLFISPNTVRNHIYNIYGKTRVKNRIQLKTLCDG